MYDLFDNINLHTHTYHCRHADGEVQDYCNKLTPATAQILGFADHAPYPDERYHWSRMFYDEMDSYCREIRQAEKEYPELKIFAGLEAEWCPDMGRDFYLNEYLGRFQLDYLIGSVHYSAFEPEIEHLFCYYDTNHVQIRRGFADNAIAAIESGVFLFLGHPDAYTYGIFDIDSDIEKEFADIIAAAKQYQMPLEINAKGFRSESGYPCRRFWEMVKDAGLPVVVSADAHAPEELYDEATEQSVELANDLALNICTGELVERLLKNRCRI